ncbi:AraC family transcriptional regulator [Puteibacter caeruleilacunae]|nr:AraC family transcriptional regulator [Puteibacter caeruleilacunae]
MSVNSLLVYCMLQTIGIMIVLFRKKFRTTPNVILNFLMFELFVKFIYQYIELEKINVPYIEPFYYLIRALGPVAIYFYARVILTGKIPEFKKVIPCLVVPLLLFVLHALPDGSRAFIEESKNGISAILLILSFLIFPLIIVYEYAKFYQLKYFEFYKTFTYNSGQTSLIAIIIPLCIGSGLMILGTRIVYLYYPHLITQIEIAGVFYSVILSYLFAYMVIVSPKVIHHKKSKFALQEFKKYDCSGLTADEAKQISNRLCDYFETSKPFLNPELNLKIVSQELNVSAKNITETLNGLIGQNFNDFTNNYRIEYFKQLLKLEKFKNYSILALAFEAGFNSKTTFNTAFKKFTGQTPSEYRKKIELKRRKNE